MNPKNIRTMAVAAVVIVMCLLFSWVQYGDHVPEESDDRFEGVWYPVYTYDSGMSAEISVPEFLEITVADGTVLLTDGANTAEYILVSEHEAVSAFVGVTNQLYLEDGTLYLISVYDEPQLNGIVYMAMSRDASATLTDDRVDLTGYSAEVGWGLPDGDGFDYPDDRGMFAVDSSSFHIAKGSVVSGNFDIRFTGFVKSDAEETVIFGYYTDADGGAGLFNAAIIDEEVTAAVMYPDAVFSFMSAELPTNLGYGTIVEDGSQSRFEVAAENGMAYVFYRNYILGMFMWTLGEDYLYLEDGSVLSYDDGHYHIVLDFMVR